MSNVDLPPDVGSDSDDDGVEMPEMESETEDEDDEQQLQSVGMAQNAGCKCKRGCHTLIDASRATELRANQLAGTDREKKERLFGQIWLQVCDADGNYKRGRIQWTMESKPVCRFFWEHMHAAGHGTLDDIMKLIKLGHKSLPEKSGIRVPSSSSKCQYIKASSWFLRLYTDLGEPYATEDPAASHLADKEMIEEPQHPLWDVGIALGTDGNRYVPTRYLNPGCFEDLFLQHQIEEGADATSKSTLLKVWNERWKKHLKFRNIGQGKRCRVCARLDEERLQATSQEERLAVGERKLEHVNMVMADREVSVRSNMMAERDAKCWSPDGVDQTVKITIDGMDQAKFKVPRNTKSTAEFESLWRPSLHVCGAICHGHLEAYFIMSSDIPKDANMNCTVIARVLDLVKEKLGVSTTPQNLVVAADNTCRESKNQTFVNYNGYLITGKKFLTTEVQYQTTGHTHNEQDQRFSTVATSLSRAPVLEDPEEFAAWIRSHVQPVRGRVLHVEVLEATYDFQKWFHALGVQIKGLAATHTEPDTNHVWRFLPRAMMAGVSDVEVHHHEWEHSQNDGDAVLMVKEFLHSEKMSQAPLLIQPVEASLRLSADALLAMPRNELGDRSIKEFLKTAEAVAKPPWHLLKAQSYLQDLCSKNLAGFVGKLVPMNFIFHHELLQTSYVPSSAFILGLPSHSTRVPRAVEGLQVAAAEQRKRIALRKRPAAAEPEDQGVEQPAAAAPLCEDQGVEQPAAAAAAGPAAAAAPLCEDQGVEQPAAAAAAAAPLCRRPAAAAAALCKRPAAAMRQRPVDKGCAKCRHALRGCTRCRALAAANSQGYRLGPDGEVLNGSTPA